MSAEEGKTDDWRSAALCIGEIIDRAGPVGYYEFSPGEWERWARRAIKTELVEAREEGRRAGLEEASALAADKLDGSEYEHLSDMIWALKEKKP